MFVPVWSEVSISSLKKFNLIQNFIIISKGNHKYDCGNVKVLQNQNFAKYKSGLVADTIKLSEWSELLENKACDAVNYQDNNWDSVL